MTGPTERLARVRRLGERIEDDPGVVAAARGELLTLADEGWLVGRTALETLGRGLRARPEAGVAAVKPLVRTLLDPETPSPGAYREGVRAVADAAPAAARDALLSALQERAAGGTETGAVRGAKLVERIAVGTPRHLEGSLGELAGVAPELPAEARVHLWRAHLPFVAERPAAVVRLLPDLLAEFDGGTAASRLAAADLLRGLAGDPDGGSAAVERLLWTAVAGPAGPDGVHRRRAPRESVLHPTLTDSPPAGVVGVAQVLARVAEECPGAVAPHATALVAALADGRRGSTDRGARQHLARAVAAVVRERPAAVAPAAGGLETLLDDDSEFVRYWAAQATPALLPRRPDPVTAERLRTLLTDHNPDVRGLGADLADAALAAGVVDADAVVDRLLGSLPADDPPCDRRVVGVLESVARQDPAAVRPAVAGLTERVADAATADRAATVLGLVAEDDPAALEPSLPALVEGLFADSRAVRAAAGETLAAVGRRAPSLLDERLPTLLSVLGDPPAVDAVDAVGEVLATVPDRPVGDDETALDRLRAASRADDATTRRTATRLLGAVARSDGDERAVDALVDRLTDEGAIREAALDGLADHVVAASDTGLVRSLYRTGTPRWRSAAATLLARATLLDGDPLPPDDQRWLARRLRETEGETRRSFVEAAGCVCGATAAVDELAAALPGALADDPTDAAVRAVRSVLTEGETTLPADPLATAVERALLDPGRSLPTGGPVILTHVAGDLDAPERVADALLDRLAAGDGGSDTGRLFEALAALADRSVAVPAAPVLAALDRYATAGPLSARDWPCREAGRLLRAAGAGPAFRETFVPRTRSDDPERRRDAYRVLASVAEEWPGGVRPAVDRLRAGLCDDDDGVRAAALSALVAVGRSDPTVLGPVVGWLCSSGSSGGSVTARRRRCEGLALLAEAEGARPPVGAYRTLRRGLLEGGAAAEAALSATAALGDRRPSPILRRLDGSVPDWSGRPDHLPTTRAEDVDAGWGWSPDRDCGESTLTAADVLEREGW